MRSYDFLSAESLAEKIAERINEEGYELLNSNELSGSIGEPDTIYDYLEVGLEDYDFNSSFIVHLSGAAYGGHRKEDIAGRDLSLKVTATCNPIIEKFGLADYELKLNGSLEYDWEDKPTE